MEKKLSFLYLQQKSNQIYNGTLRADTINLDRAVIYGNIRALEHGLHIEQDPIIEEGYKDDLKKLAQEHGIIDYKL